MSGTGSACDVGRCPFCSATRLAVLLTMLVAAAGGLYLAGRTSLPPREIEWPQFLEELKAGEIERVVADGREYRGWYKPGGAHERFVTRGPELDAEPGLREIVEKHAELDVRE